MHIDRELLVRSIYEINISDAVNMFNILLPRKNISKDSVYVHHNFRDGEVSVTAVEKMTGTGGGILTVNTSISINMMGEIRRHSYTFNSQSKSQNELESPKWVPLSLFVYLIHRNYNIFERIDKDANIKLKK